MFSLILFLSALGLSGVVAGMAIYGLMLTFPASALMIALYGGAIEAGKLAGASFLYRYWETASRSLRYSLTTLVLLASLTTSIGVFGFLSRSHLETGSKVELVVQRDGVYTAQLGIEERRITDARTALTQLDASVDRLMETNPTSAIALRSRQRTERTSLLNTIRDAEASRVAILTTQIDSISPVDTEVELGPLKYMAEVLYKASDKEATEKAVRGFILLLMIIGDPFALLLVIAANHTRQKPREDAPIVPVERETIILDAPMEDLPFDDIEQYVEINDDDDLVQGKTRDIKRTKEVRRTNER